jgi:hypothetical protein
MAKRPRDPNQLAKAIVDLATRNEGAGPEKADPARDFAREGGLKGGKARAEKLTRLQRIEIARKAAAARWSKTR